MMRFATKTDADLVIASLPVSKKEAGRMGIFKMNDRFEITNFHEKPEDEALLERFSNSEELFDKIGLLPQNGKHYLGSMGIYLFKRSALFDLLKEDPREDFGKHLIPTKVKLGKVAAFIHNGYWEDIGTIESFYRANLNLTNDYPDFDYYNEANPLFTTRYNLPAPKISQAKINKSIICEGSIVQAKEVSQSILGPRTVIKKGSMIKDTYIMGNDFYHPPIRHMNKLPEHLFIGEHCLIKKAIIDKNVFIGNHVQLINRDNLTHFNGDNIYIRDGVIVVPRGATIPDHYCL